MSLAEILAIVFGVGLLICLGLLVYFITRLYKMWGDL